jgi:hypothetical protein
VRQIDVDYKDKGKKTVCVEVLPHRIRLTRQSYAPIAMHSCRHDSLPVT